MIAWLDERTGLARVLRAGLRKVFPDHWSFLLGEVALYAFIVLVATGIYLTFFFEPSTTTVVYHGTYAPLQGQEMTEAYRSVLDISFRVKAGLLIRQTDHWAANVFVAAVVLHLLRTDDCTARPPAAEALQRIRRVLGVTSGPVTRPPSSLPTQPPASA